MFVIINKRIYPTKTIFNRIKYLFAKKINKSTVEFESFGAYECYEMLCTKNLRKASKIKARLADTLESEDVKLAVCENDEELKNLLFARGISVAEEFDIYIAVSDKIMMHLIDESGYEANTCKVAVCFDRLGQGVRKTALNLARNVKELLLVSREPLVSEFAEEIYDQCGASVVTLENLSRRDDVFHFLCFGGTKEVLSDLAIVSEGYVLNLEKTCRMYRMRGFSVADGAKFKLDFPRLPVGISENDFICALWIEGKIKPEDLKISSLTVTGRPAKIRKSQGLTMPDV